MSIHSTGIGHDNGSLLIGHNGGPPLELADDLLEEAGAISLFIYGVNDYAHRRKIYRWVAEVDPENRLPTFRRGSTICARKSTILAFIAGREAASGEAAP